MSGELKEDYLTRDPPVPGQAIVLMSFVSPEKILEDKQLYYMWHYERHLQSKIEELNNKLKEAMNSEDTGVEINKTKPCSFKNFKELFLDFEYAQHKKIEETFYELNDFTTTVRGLKIKRVCADDKEAEHYAKKYRNSDSSHHVFKGDVGAWLPWDPHPDDIEDQDYAEGELNTLMKKKKENEVNKNMYWEEEKRQKMEAIQRDNLRRQRENEQLELEDGDTSTLEEVISSPAEGGAGKEMGHSISDDVKAGLVADDPWLQRKLLEEAGAENNTNDTALDNIINEVGGETTECKT